MNIDIIEFVRPDDNKNSLYITGVSETIEQNELYVCNVFNAHALILLCCQC